MTEIINAIGRGFTQFFKIMPIVGDYVNYFIILSLSVATIYWIYYMMKNPGKDENYLSK